MIKKTILIVDDLYENLYLLRVILEKSDFIVIEALNGEEALEKLHKHSVDLIISDILMPVMDGYMFCQACKKDKLFKNIPFVFYTSTYTEKSDEEFAFKLGAAHFLIKPTDPDKILQLVKELLTLDTSTVKPKEKEQFTEKEVLKLYSKRLIRKLEQKNLDLEKEILEREKVEQKLINENVILDLIANNTPIKKVFNHIILNYESLHPEFFGSISLMQDDSNYLDLISAPSIPKSYNTAIKHIEITENAGSCGTAAFLKKPVIVSDISSDKRWVDYKDIALKHNLKSCWCVPILSEKNQTLGTFAIYSNSIKTPSLEDIQELNSAVSLAKIAIVKFNIMAEVKKRDESYKSLINQASDAILTYSFDGTIHTLNKAAYNILGYTKKEFLKLNFEDVLVGDIIENQATYEKIINGKSIIFERQIICKNEVIIDVEISAKLQADGKVLAIIRDISERKRAEIELKESEKSLLVAQKLAKTGSYNFDLKTQLVQCSSSYKDIVGIDLNAKMTYDIWLSITDIENTPNPREVFEKCLETGEKFDLEYKIITKNKKAFKWVHGLGEVVYVDGVPSNFYGTIQDVTERKEAEKKLILSEYNLRQSQVVANIGSYSLDINTMTWESSAIMDKIFGINKSFVKNIENWTNIIHPDEREGVLHYFENNVLTNKEKFNREYRILKVDNKKEVWVHGVGEIVLDNDGNPIKMIGTIQDITERKKAEIAHKAAKDFTDKLIMSMQEGLIIVNLEGTIIMVNESICGILGYSNDELIGLNIPYPFVTKNESDRILKAYEKEPSAESLNYKIEFIRKNGEKFLASFLSGNINNDEGEVIALFGTIKDISEEEKAKKLLIETATRSTKKKHVIMELSALVGSDYNKSLQQITALSADTLNAARVGVWKFNEDKTSIICEKLYVLKTGKFENGVILSRNDNPNYFDALVASKTVSVEDAVNNDITKGFAKDYLVPFGISSMLDVFIHGGQGSYGVVCFEHIGAKRKWSADEEEFATSIANIVSLMVENKERIEAESLLRRAKEFSEKLITSLHEGLSVVDLNGTHIKVNQALCEMTGFSEAELVGKKAPFPYWPPEGIDEINVAFKNPLKAIDGSMYFTFMRKNGERFPVSLTNSSIKNKEGGIEAYFSTINDISIRVKAEEILKENIRISDQRRHIIIELANLIGEDFNSSLKKIATTASEALNADLVTIWKYENEKSELVSRLFYKSKDKKFDFGGLVIREADYQNYFNVFKDKNSINITDVINNPITKDFAKTYFIPNNISSRIDVLIYGRNDHYGIISFESKTAGRVFTNEEESFVTSIASIVSLMIESSERQIAENNLVLSNKELSKANIELNNLRDQLEQENVYLRNELDLVFNYEEMVYGSEEFSNVLTEVEQVAPTNATVLLLGESGTGKELLARAIHKIGSRNNKPLIKVNCSAIPRELIESELFGHKKGSFTGAFSDKIGKFELADGGTLFLDEIGELPLDMQPKILRFLQEGEIEVVGGTQLKKLDVRVIAATNRNLKEEIEKKQFREDLYFRINVFPIQIPPLRKRKDDIPLLVEHFVDKFNKSYEKSIKYISGDSMDMLKSYKWPGNIRELENLIERAVILSTSETLMLSPVGDSSVIKELSVSASSLTLNEVQRNHIIKTLEKCDWKIDGENGASKVLDIKPSTLRDRMKKLGIKKPAKI